MKIADNALGLVGNTPLVRLNRIAQGANAQVVAKLEYDGPGASIKGPYRCGDDRGGGACRRVAARFHRRRTTHRGNTGIALAWVCAVKGYKCLLFMPESISEERRGVVRAASYTP